MFWAALSNMGAVHWYSRGLISQERAAQVAGQKTFGEYAHCVAEAAVEDVDRDVLACASCAANTAARAEPAHKCARIQ